MTASVSHLKIIKPFNFFIDGYGNDYVLGPSGVIRILSESFITINIRYFFYDKMIYEKNTSIFLTQTKKYY